MTGIKGGKANAAKRALFKKKKYTKIDVMHGSMAKLLPFFGIRICSVSDISMSSPLFLSW